MTTVLLKRTLVINMNVVSVTTLRNNLADTLLEVENKKDYLLIAKKGKITSAIVDIDFFEDLLMANSPEYVKSIKEARKDFKAGRIYTHEQAFGEI